MIRFYTAGESHGQGLVVIIEGIPSGLSVDVEYINKELKKRQSFYGRGKRMLIEEDKVKIISGIRGGKTLGSPVSFFIENKDWENWREQMDPLKLSPHPPVSRPRPGHADLAGAFKFGVKDLRNISERASARETAARVAAGSLCKLLLQEFGINIWGWVEEIGGIKVPWEDMGREEIKVNLTRSDILCPDPEREKEIVALLKEIEKEGDTVGGKFVIVISGVPPGLGSFTQWEKRLDARLCFSLMSIPGIKGVEVGDGFSLSCKRGSEAMDEIFLKEGKIVRGSNHMGGIEGGISNGEDIILKAVMKPIPTLRKPLRSIDLISGEETKAQVERGDVCAVPSACVIGESMVAIEIASQLKEKFGGDSLKEMKANFNNYLNSLKENFYYG